MKWDKSITEFSSFLKLEKSLSANTVEAYVKDVNKLQEFIKIKEYSYSPVEITYTILKEFIEWINELGVSARSQARIISGLKSF